MAAAVLMVLVILSIVLLSVVFCIIRSSSGKNAWLIGAVVCSVAAGVMGAVLCLRAGVGIMMYFATKALGSGLDYVVDFAAFTVLFALVCLLCSMLIGSAFNAKKNGQAYCPLWKLLLSIFSVAAGVAITLCFFYLLLTQHVGTAALARFRTADVIFMLSGLAFVLAGTVGISRWRHVRTKITVEKAEAKAAEKAAKEQAAAAQAAAAQAQQPQAIVEAPAEPQAAVEAPSEPQAGTPEEPIAQGEAAAQALEEPATEVLGEGENA